MAVAFVTGQNGELAAVPHFEAKVPISGLDDFTVFRGYWLVSEKMKATLSEIDSDGFDFVACEVIDKNGSLVPRRWLCNVLRVLDALDESSSNIEVKSYEGGKRYSFQVPQRLIFRDEVVGTARIFRMANSETTIICDDILKEACRAAKLRGARFEDAIAPYAKTPDKWINHLRNTIKTDAQFPVAIRASGRELLAKELLKAAKDQAGTEALEEAISLFREIIGMGYRPSRPELAKMYNDIGLTLLMIFGRKGDRAVLEAAIAALTEAELLASTPSPGFRYEGFLLAIAEKELMRAREGLKQARALTLGADAWPT